MQTTNRLVCVLGPWQLVLAVSAMKQAARSRTGSTRDTLVFYSPPDGPLSQPLREVMIRIAAAIWPWQKVVILDEAIKWWTLHDARATVEAVRARLGEDEPAELWLGHVANDPLKIAAEAYPSARIVLYEDGLHSYLPVQDHHLSVSKCFTEPRGILRAVKMRIRERMRPWDLSLSALLPRHRSRIAESYLWISLAIAPPDSHRRLPWTQLHTSFVKETIQRVIPCTDEIEIEPGTARRAVLLGQCFSNYGDISREEERDRYIDLALRVKQMGYEVLWKEHPRMRQPFLPDLVKAVPEVRALPDLGPWPIEVFVERLGLSACAGLTSTSLFTIPLLFNLPSFSAAHHYLSKLKFPNNVLARLVADSISQVGANTVEPARAFPVTAEVPRLELTRLTRATA
jgi:alpha-2,8-polysialyltransferase (POLYST)